MIQPSLNSSSNTVTKPKGLWRTFEKQIFLALAILCSTTAWSRPLGPDSIVAETLTRFDGPDNTFIQIAQPLTSAEFATKRANEINAFLQELARPKTYFDELMIKAGPDGFAAAGVGAALTFAGLVIFCGECMHPTQDPVKRKHVLRTSALITATGATIVAAIGYLVTSH